MDSPIDPKALPPRPRPPEIPPNIEPEQLKPEPGPEETKKILKPNHVPMTRRGTGTKEQRVPLLCNHFKVNIADGSGHFYQYSVS